jgi:RNA polymerase sigma factor (sigma-70 family)
VDNDSELLRQYAEHGSEDAFRELVRLRLGIVYASALRQLGDARRAEDVAQEVFADLARKASTLCRRPILVSWLYTSTRYAAVSLLRRERRQQVRDHEALLMQEIRSDSASDEVWLRLRPVLDEELHRLGAGDRDAILLRFFEGKSYSDVGEALTLSEDAARKRIDRALDRLRLRLSGRGITSTSEALAVALAGQAVMAAPAGLIGAVATAALARTAAAGAAGAGLLGSAAFTAVTMALGGVLAVVAGGAAIHEAMQARSASAELDALKRQHDLALRSVSSKEGRIADAEKSLADVERRAKIARTVVTPAPKGPGGTSSQDPTARGREFMARHPEVRAAFLADIDALNLGQYAALYASLGLTPEKIQRMQALLRFGMGYGTGIHSGTLALSATDDISDAAYAEQQAGIKALLGDQGYQLFKEYSWSVPARTLTANLASLLADTDSPLTSGQAQLLATVLAGSASSKDSSQFDWSSVNPKAQGMLSGAQFAMLQNLETYSQGWQQVLDASH